MEIALDKACIYKDGRCHGVFTDGSAVVLHRGGCYSTYFSPTGEITRQVTLCAVSGVKTKIMKLINLCNTSLANPIAAFAEEIYKVSSNEAKVLSCTFQNPGCVKVISNNTEVSSFSIDPEKDSIFVVHQDTKGNLKCKSIEKTVSASLNPSNTLFKVTFPFLLPHRKPSWSENSASRVRLTYEYVKLTQIFHIQNVPETWTPVLSLLLVSSGNEVAFSGPEEVQILFPTSLPGEVWSSDTVSPSVNLYNYLGENLYWSWKAESTLYISPGQVLLLIHEDQSLLEASGDFFTHIRQENSLKFTSETVPVNVRNASYKLHGFVKDCRDVQSLPVIQKQSKPFEEELENTDGVKVENDVEGVGSFIAYNDKSIRVLFDDRTLIRIYSDFTVSAISRTGETARFSLENPYGFEKYVPVCVEFYNWAFLSQNEQVKRAQDSAEREAIVNMELSRAERISGKYQVAESSDEVSESLLEAERRLKETRELLNKLNFSSN